MLGAPGTGKLARIVKEWFLLSHVGGTVDDKEPALGFGSVAHISSVGDSVESKQRWPLFVAHELAGYLLNVTAASTIKPLPYRGAERAAEVTLLERNWPPFFSANFFGPAFFLSS
jgi:hypothetical protein